MQTYLDEVVGYAAGKVLNDAAMSLLTPLDRRDARRNFLRTLPTTFPNALGNYKGKRTPKPAPKPLTAKERFARLVAQYEAFRCR